MSELQQNLGNYPTEEVSQLTPEQAQELEWYEAINDIYQLRNSGDTPELHLALKRFSATGLNGRYAILAYAGIPPMRPTFLPPEK